MEAQRPSLRDINVAIVAHPANPPGPSGGAEMFAGMLANSLVDQGPFNVRVYGHRGPTYPFRPEVTYVESGPSAKEIEATNNVSSRRSITEAASSLPARLTRDIVTDLRQNPEKQWVVFDNDITTRGIAGFLALHNIPHAFIHHSFTEENLADIYQEVVDQGARVIAIADHQRAAVEDQFGPLHDTTIKNGVPSEGTLRFNPRPSLAEGMRIGTLSRIQGSDEKGVRFALEAVKELQGWGHAARLNIAGKINDRTFYDQVIAPHIGTLAHYAGMLAGQDKSDYLDGLHVGAALSNPGNYNLEKNKFEGEFEEGNSLVLPEMMLHGVIPVSTDSGGAEALVDAGFDDFIVPLKTLEERGHDAFINEVAATMLDAATTPLSRHEISSRVRTADDMGGEYAEYIMKLANPKTIFTAPRRKARFNNLVQLPAASASGSVNE